MTLELPGIPENSVLVAIDGDLVIRTNALLESLGTAFEFLESITGRLTISANDELPHITADAFPALTSVGGRISVLNNDKLTTISGFNNLVTVDDINISRGGLQTVDGFENVETINGTRQLLPCCLFVCDACPRVGRLRPDDGAASLTRLTSVRTRAFNMLR